MAIDISINDTPRAARPRSPRLRQAGGTAQSWAAAAPSAKAAAGASTSYVGDGHTHDNKALLDAFMASGGYLFMGGQGVRAAWADDAGLWDGHTFDEWLDQPVRTTSKVSFATVGADEVAADEVIAGTVHATANIEAGGTASAAVVAATTRAVADLFVNHGTFVPGILGSGFGLRFDPETGLSSLDVDQLTVRQRMTAMELLIEQVRAVGGTLVVSPASGRVRETIRPEQTEGGTWRVVLEGENHFQPGDLVRCARFTGTDLRAYWVEVVDVDTEAVYFLPEDFPEGVEPAAGDELVLLGNTMTARRGNAILISASENGTPVVDVLSGIRRTSLDGCLRTRLGGLDGISDTAFPSGAQPSGYGLYADNAYLRGTFVLASGKDIGTAVGTLSSQTASLKAAADAIELRVASAEASISSQDGQIAAMRENVSDINQRADAIELTVAERKVGGRNYYHAGCGLLCMCPDGTYASPLRKESGFILHTTILNLTQVHVVRISGAITANGWWTVSFDLSTGTTHASALVFASIDVCDGASSETFSASGKAVTHCTYSVEVTNQSDSVYNFVDIELYGRYTVPAISRLKIERGNVPTDYDFAPEDTVAAINLSPNTAAIRASKIALEGYTTINGHFSVDEQGNAHMVDAHVAGRFYHPYTIITKDNIADYASIESRSGGYTIGGTSYSNEVPVSAVRLTSGNFCYQIESWPECTYTEHWTKWSSGMQLDGTNEVTEPTPLLLPASDEYLGIELDLLVIDPPGLKVFFDQDDEGAGTTTLRFLTTLYEGRYLVKYIARPSGLREWRIISETPF